MSEPTEYEYWEIDPIEAANQLVATKKPIEGIAVMGTGYPYWSRYDKAGRRISLKGVSFYDHGVLFHTSMGIAGKCALVAEITGSYDEIDLTLCHEEVKTVRVVGGANWVVKLREGISPKTQKKKEPGGNQ